MSKRPEAPFETAAQAPPEACQCCSAEAGQSANPPAPLAEKSRAPKWPRWPALPWTLRHRRKPVSAPPAGLASGFAAIPPESPIAEAPRGGPIAAAAVRDALRKAQNPNTGESLIAAIDEIAIEGSMIWVVMRVENTDAPITIMHRLAIEHALYALPAVTHVVVLSSRYPEVRDTVGADPFGD